MLFLLNNVCIAMDNTHEIDIQLENCLKNKYLTKDMNSCVINARNRWFNEINFEIEYIQKILDKKQIKIFEKSHKQWLKYYKKEQQFINKTLFEKSGDINTNFGNNYLLNITKQRALYLKQLLYSLTY